MMNIVELREAMEKALEEYGFWCRVEADSSYYGEEFDHVADLDDAAGEVCYIQSLIAYELAENTIDTQYDCMENFLCGYSHKRGF